MDKKCFRCGETKLRSEFRSRKQSKDGLMASCKDCINGASAEKRKQIQENHGCSIDGCKTAAYTLTPMPMCSMHRSRYWQKGDVGGAERTRAARGEGAYYVDSHGYRVVGTRDNRILEHRLVMEQHLGRKLLPNENVHHINGDRLDNRLENLELWNTSQPAGQRVEDKVAWALELLKTYAPEMITVYEAI